MNTTKNQNKMKLFKNESNAVTLEYVRIAKKSVDGENGLLYIYQSPSGNQTLIFPNAQSADEARRKLQEEYSEKRTRE